MCWMCCHPPVVTDADVLCAPRHIPGTPWGLCVCWVLPGVFLVLSHGLECWFHTEPGKETAQQLLVMLLGELQVVPGTPWITAVPLLFPCCCYKLFCLFVPKVSSFFPSLHPLKHSHSFGQTLGFCLLTNPVGTTWILTICSPRQGMLSVRPLSREHFKDRWKFLILSVRNS